MKKIIGSLILLFVFSATSFAAELKVVTENWKPYNYEENGEIKGISTEIVKAVLDNAKIPYGIKVHLWTDAYAIAQKEENVLIYTINRTPQREKLFKWVSPIGKDIQYSLYRLKKNDNVAPASLEEAKKYKVGAYKDSVGQIWLAAEGFPEIISPVEPVDALKKLVSGEVDLIIESTSIINKLKEAGLNQDDVVAVLPLFQTTPYMALSLSTSDDILNQMQQSYDALLKDNKIKIGE